MGKGSFGKVKLCLDQRTGRPFAIKIIKRSLLRKRKFGAVGGPRSQDNLQKILREIAIMKKIRHPHTVQLAEVLDDPESEKLYLVLEYVDGGCVLSERDREALVKFPLNKARSYFRDVVTGLEYLHSQNIIHHDLKPENLLVTADDRIKIGDFGVSLLAADDGDDTLSEVPGTPAFVAPECIKGAFHGKMADVWSMGICLYQFVTGTVPFLADNSPEIFEKITNDEPVFPPDLPESLTELLRGILTKNPAERMTLDAVKEHAWVTKHGSEPLITTVPALLEVTEAEVEGAVSMGAGLLLKEAQSMMEARTYQPGDFLIKKGEVGLEMYFIDEGECHVLSEDGDKVVATRKAGAFIGEMALLISAVRTASVRAATEMRVLVLSKANLDKILSTDESSRQMLLETAKLREQELKKYNN